MSGFIAWLEDINKRDTKVRAMLRRSLAFHPGAHIPTYPYVEPFLKGEGEGESWRRSVHYLVAGLWAAHRREGRVGATTSLATACALHQIGSGSVSTERRFIHLLDADREQLPHRLRQMVALLSEQSLDFQSLLNDVRFWNSAEKRVQIAWAREFYCTLIPTKVPYTETESAA